MDRSLYVDFLENYYLATQLPISIFEKKQHVAQGAPHIHDLGLPLHVLSCLPDLLPDL